MQQLNWHTIRPYIAIVVAFFPFALMVNWIFVPHNVVGGGLTGICSIIYYATYGHVPIWLSSLVINGLLLTIAALTVGWQFCVRTVFGVLVLAFWYWLIPIRETPLIEDPFLACIVGGVVFGLCLGMVMLNNGSSGGTDIIAKIINRYRHISLGKVMVLCDLIIIACSWLLPIPEGLRAATQTETQYKIFRMLYGLCMTVSYTFALDWLMLRRQSRWWGHFTNFFE